MLGKLSDVILSAQSHVAVSDWITVNYRKAYGMVACF